MGGQLVCRYHDGIVAAGVEGYDWQRCWRDYRFSVAQQAWSTLPMGDFDPGNERGPPAARRHHAAVPRRRP